MNTITIVGLGPGDFGSLTLEAYKALKDAETLMLRTAKHPMVSDLAKEGVKFETYDDYYDSATDFESLYDGIFRNLLELAGEGDVMYAVPGSPFVGESVVGLLLDAAEAGGVEVKVIPGLSAIDACAQAVGLDMGEGLTVLDGYELMNAPRVNVDRSLPLLVLQISDKLVLGRVVEALLDAHYDEESPVCLIQRAGLDDESAEWMRLYEVLRHEPDHLTSLYVPASGEEGYHGFEGFVDLVAKLRSPDGCPWDRRQTHSSLKPYVLEEAYETIDAIDSGNPESLREELGDLLFQVVLQSQIAKEDSEFDLDQVIETIIEKMLRRHPHVFGDLNTRDTSVIYGVWDEIKREEKGVGTIAEDMRAIPKVLPAVATANKIQSKARKVGFDWDNPYDALDKVYEEAGEVREVLDEPDGPEREERLLGEVGDLLFAAVNVARLAGVDAEDAIRATNRKFIERFGFMEQEAAKLGKSLKEMPLEEMEELWVKAKS